MKPTVGSSAPTRSVADPGAMARLWRPLFFLVVLATGVAGCATTRQAPAEEATPHGIGNSGFLSDYSKLGRGGKGQALYVYTKGGADIGRYRKILLERVTLWRGGDDAFKDIPHDDLRRLADHLYLAIQRRLEPDYELVEEGGPDTLDIHLALTDVRASNVALDVFATVAPPARVLSELDGMATGTQAFVGAATVEFEMTDSDTGEVLAMAIDRRVGRRSLDGALDSWSDVEEAFAYWADKLATRLAEARRGEWPPQASDD